MRIGRSLFTFFIILAAILSGCQTAPPPNPDREAVLCVRVIDGDTIVLGDGRHVRLTDREAFEIRHGARLDRQAKAAGISVEAALARGREQAAALRTAVEGRRLVIKWATPRFDFYGRSLGAIIEVKP